MDSLWHAFGCATLLGNGTLWQFIFYLRNNCLLTAIELVSASVGHLVFVINQLVL